MRRKGKVDLIQADAVRGLRSVGASVQVCSAVGGGFPDLLVGYHGVNILVELKTGDEPLTKDQVEWHAKWGGQICIARSAEEAVIAVIKAAGLIPPERKAA